MKIIFRHMLHDARVHAPSRANFIKLASLRLKLCTEAEDSVLKPALTIGSCNPSPKDRSQRSPSFSHPGIAASPDSHFLSDSACFKDLIIKLLAAGDPRVTVQ